MQYANNIIQVYLLKREGKGGGGWGSHVATHVNCLNLQTRHKQHENTDFIQQIVLSLGSQSVNTLDIIQREQSFLSAPKQK